MSYNVSNVETIVNKAFIKVKDVRRLLKSEENLSEDCFLHDLEDEVAELGKDELVRCEA